MTNPSLNTYSASTFILLSFGLKTGLEYLNHQYNY